MKINILELKIHIKLCICHTVELNTITDPN